MGLILTRGFVWLALTAYSLSAVLQMRERHHPARAIWLAGCVAFLAHVACAFHFFHDWSHAHALEQTARQTAELTGLRTGAGLYLNYLFTGTWVADAAWWLWVGHEPYARRVRWVTISLHAFFVFMIVNGAIVFVAGPARWYGAALLLLLAAGTVHARRSIR